MKKSYDWKRPQAVKGGKRWKRATAVAMKKAGFALPAIINEVGEVTEKEICAWSRKKNKRWEKKGTRRAEQLKTEHYPIVLNREDKRYICFRLNVLKRDNFSCVNCGKTGGMLHVHHIKKWTKFPKLRLCDKNCITLCLDCHIKIHPFMKNYDMSSV